MMDEWEQTVMERGPGQQKKIERSHNDVIDKLKHNSSTHPAADRAAGGTLPKVKSTPLESLEIHGGSEIHCARHSFCLLSCAASLSSHGSHLELHAQIQHVQNAFTLTVGRLKMQY